MDGLVTWLRAQLDDDERLAQQVILSRHGALFVPRQDGSAPAVEVIPGSRLLAEVEAKRRILEAVERYLDPHPGQPCTNLDEEGEHTWEPCELHVERMATAITPYVLPLLALPYADRPGYREEWRP